METELLSLDEVCQVTGLGMTTIKKLISEGELLSVTVGKRRLVPASAVRDFVARLIARSQAQPGGEPHVDPSERAG